MYLLIFKNLAAMLVRFEYAFEIWMVWLLCGCFSFWNLNIWTLQLFWSFLVPWGEWEKNQNNKFYFSPSGFIVLKCWKYSVVEHSYLSWGKSSILKPRVHHNWNVCSTLKPEVTLYRGSSYLTKRDH